MVIPPRQPPLHSRIQESQVLQKAESREQTAEMREQTAEMREQTAEMREQTAESREQRAESREHEPVGRKVNQTQQRAILQDMVKF
jgi:hypothetical protein